MCFVHYYEENNNVNWFVEGFLFIVLLNFIKPFATNDAVTKAHVASIFKRIKLQ